MCVIESHSEVDLAAPTTQRIATVPSRNTQPSATVPVPDTPVGSLVRINRNVLIRILSGLVSTRTTSILGALNGRLSLGCRQSSGACMHLRTCVAICSRTCVRPCVSFVYILCISKVLSYHYPDSHTCEPYGDGVYHQCSEILRHYRSPFHA